MRISKVVLLAFHLAAKIKILLDNRPPEQKKSSFNVFMSDKDWCRLNQKSMEVMRQNNSSAYEQLLKVYDPEISLIEGVIKSQFIGAGVAQDSLNTYRKVMTEKRVLFEKIYHIHSTSPEKLTWFADNIYPQLHQLGIYTPPLVKSIKGKRLFAVYFEFLDSKIDNVRNYLEHAAEISLKLTKIKQPENTPIPYSSFKQHALYSSSFKTAQEEAVSFGIENSIFYKCEEWLESTPKCFAHGDLHGKNLGKPNIVIDWDEYGFYPIGFDIALSMSKSLSIASPHHLSYYLETQIKPRLESDKDWLLLRKAIVLFCIIFYSRNIGKKIDSKTWTQLILNHAYIN